MWCSFELKNEVLLSSMLSQYAGVDLLKEPHRFDYYADQFENIPLFFQTYFGSTHVDDVTAMIDYAAYTHDIGHVVIDNLQFMLSGQGRGIERFEMQDDVIAKLRKLATNLNIHITLVIHPRKGEEGADLSLSSIFGTAKSTQEADNVMILQQRDKYRVMDVKKNRYDGEIGKSSLWFDRSSKRFEQITAKEIEELLTGAKIEDVLGRKNREVREDLAAVAGKSEYGIPKVAIIEKQSEGTHTSEQLHEQLESRNAPKPKQRFPRAFGRLEEIRLAMVQANKEEPDIPEVPEDIRNSFIVSPLDPYVDTQPAGQPVRKGDVDYYDPFEIKFEGDPKHIGISVKVSSLSTDKPSADTLSARIAYHETGSSGEEDDSSKKARYSTTAASTAASSGDIPGSRPQSKNILAGMQVDQHFEPIKNMYQEGAILFSYNDMIGELLDKKPYSAGKHKKYQEGSRGGEISYSSPTTKQGKKKTEEFPQPREDDN